MQSCRLTLCQLKSFRNNITLHHSNNVELYYWSVLEVYIYVYAVCAQPRVPLGWCGNRKDWCGDGVGMGQMQRGWRGDREKYCGDDDKFLDEGWGWRWIVIPMLLSCGGLKLRGRFGDLNSCISWVCIWCAFYQLIYNWFSYAWSQLCVVSLTL